MSKRKKVMRILVLLSFLTIVCLAVLTLVPSLLEKNNGIQHGRGTIEIRPGKYKPQMSNNLSAVGEGKATVKKHILLAKDEIHISDLYTESGKEAVFCCFDKDATEYLWEIYDGRKKEWVPAPEGDIFFGSDELLRNVSILKITNQGEEDLMIRCTVKSLKGTAAVQTACLYTLKGKIKEIGLERYKAEANTYICAKDIPVKVVYEDGTEETITGLNGLYFIQEEEKSESFTGISGNKTETTTTTFSEHSYIKAGTGEEEMRMRYNGNRYPEAVLTIDGRDCEAPQISDVKINPFTPKNMDIPVTLTVSIIAEDNETPHPYLEYAFVPAGTDIGAIEWTKKSNFDVEIVKNGIYAACVRDKVGNIAQEETEIITVDMKPPTLHVSLSQTGWCKSNEIIAEAKDASKVEYSYGLKENGAESGWVLSNTYTVAQNGTYVIRVKDAAGNVAETEIIVSNIDNEPPTIQNIIRKKGD